MDGLSQEKRRSVQQRIDEVQRLKRAATATAAPSAAAPSEEQPALEIPEGGGWVPSGVNTD